MVAMAVVPSGTPGATLSSSISTAIPLPCLFDLWPLPLLPAVDGSHGGGTKRHPRRNPFLLRLHSHPSSMSLRSLPCGRIRAHEQHGLPVSLSTSTGLSCQQGGISDDSKNYIPVLELGKLPEDVLHHILSLVPLRDAAHAACVSRNFLCSWRRFPNLTFNWETLGVNLDDAPLRESAKELVNRINCILENHSGTGVKTLKLQVSLCGGVITANLLDIWLQASVKSGIVELHLDLPRINSLPFNLSCSLISSAASSLHSLSLTFCAFHPTPTIGLRNLKNVRLALVHITEEELGCLFSCTTSLEKFEVFWCHDFTSLKIPSHLQKLSFLRVFLCRRLQMIEINAPNVSTFMFRGPPMKILIINSLQLKRVAMDGQFYSGMFQYALTKLQSITSNLQALTLFSTTEAFNMPASPDKFLHLRNLKIYCCGMENFDFLSLISFLKSCPALESFFLSAGPHFDVRQDSIIHGSSSAVSSHMRRRIAGFHQGNLKKVTITGFCSSKSLIELTRQILESCSSLQSLVLDTTGGYDNTGICDSMGNKAVMEALRGLEAIKNYIKGKVPSSVNLEVLEPCGQCHVPKLRKLGPC